jgi:hypothetical protein
MPMPQLTQHFGYDVRVLFGGKHSTQSFAVLSTINPSSRPARMPAYGSGQNKDFPKMSAYSVQNIVPRVTGTYPFIELVMETRPPQVRLLMHCAWTNGLSFARWTIRHHDAVQFPARVGS